MSSLLVDAPRADTPPKETRPKETPPPEETLADKHWLKDAAEAVVDHDAIHLTKTATGSTNSRVANAVVVRADGLWRNGSTLNFGFMDRAPYSTFQSNQQQKIRDTIKEWENYANIKFVYVADISIAVIRIAFDRRSGSWSFIGTDHTSIEKDQATMNLGWVNGDTVVATADESADILKEFGHTLGLMQELQSPVRGDTLTLKRQAAIDFYTDGQHWEPADVENNILSVYNSSQVSNYSQLDTKSIMMYFMPAALNEQNVEIKPNKKLSELDKAFMIINYPPSDRQKFTDALDIAGVDGNEKTSILKSYDSENWNKVRDEFTKFCKTTRGARKSTDAVAVNELKPMKNIPATGCITSSAPDADSLFAVDNKLGGDHKVNRMDLADALLRDFQAAKQAWELDRGDIIENLLKDEDSNEFNRRLAYITAMESRFEELRDMFKNMKNEDLIDFDRIVAQITAIQESRLGELARDDMIQNKNDDLKDFNRMLADITALQNSRLAPKHADAVVRDNSHDIETGRSSTKDKKD